MLKRNIVYVDYNGDNTTETFYFNLSKSELVEMEMSTNEGFGDTLKKIIKTKDSKELIKIFKNLILDSYGEKSDDGKRFIKNAEMRVEFSQTAAYNALFMELATDDNAAAEFIKGILPKDMSVELEKELQTPNSVLDKAKEAISTETAFDQIQRTSSYSAILPPPPAA